MEEQGYQWEHLTHSTLVIGYGEEKSAGGETVKYWKVRNSYGPTWGESVNFRIKRGQNDFACETENFAATPVLM